MSSINKKYLDFLAKHPLLTKSSTGAVFAALNEIIASKLASESLLSTKVPLLAAFAFFIQSPFSHYAFEMLNNLKWFKGKQSLSLKKKLLQIFISLSTITPITCLLNAIILAIISKHKDILECKNSLSEIKKLMRSSVPVIKYNFLKFIKSSWISSPLIIFFAQNFLQPSVWVVFFNFAYFLLGTYNNTIFKLNMKKLRNESLKEEAKEEAEKQSKKDEL